jgi:hypothetical protein
LGASVSPSYSTHIPSSLNPNATRRADVLPLGIYSITSPADSTGEAQSGNACEAIVPIARIVGDIRQSKVPPKRTWSLHQRYGPQRIELPHRSPNPSRRGRCPRDQGATRRRLESKGRDEGIADRTAAAEIVTIAHRRLEALCTANCGLARGKAPPGVRPACQRARRSRWHCSPPLVIPGEVFPRRKGAAQILTKIFWRNIQKQTSQNMRSVERARTSAPYGPAKASGPKWVRTVDATKGFMSWAII